MYQDTSIPVQYANIFDGIFSTGRMDELQCKITTAIRRCKEITFRFLNSMLHLNHGQNKQGLAKSLPHTQ